MMDSCGRGAAAGVKRSLVTLLGHRTGYPMTTNDTLHQRIEALETRLMHQDQVIEDLNAAITAQWRKIDSLVRQVTQFHDRLRDLGTAGAAGQDPPPPHY